MTTVNCTVSSCEYWGEGNECHASEILVEPNPLTTSLINKEVRHEEETYCKTFERKENV